MQFITEQDIRVLIKEREELTVVDGNTALLGPAEQAAIERMKSGLRQANYDVDYEFGRSGDNRNPWLVTVCCHITIYILFTRINQKYMPERRKMDYDEAITWLERVADGKESPSLKKITVTDPNGNTTAQSRLRIGSEPKLTHRW